jgi:hypothetical protein
MKHDVIKYDAINFESIRQDVIKLDVIPGQSECPVKNEGFFKSLLFLRFKAWTDYTKCPAMHEEERVIVVQYVIMLLIV